jgi:RNA polymerase sigma-70 factor (ECF subfamily)
MVTRELECTGAAPLAQLAKERATLRRFDGTAALVIAANPDWRGMSLAMDCPDDPAAPPAQLPVDNAAAYRCVEASALLAALRRREDDAVRQVMAEEMDGVYSVALGILGRQDDAEDACQEVFMRLLQSAPRLSPGTSLRAWLRRVCLNYCLDQRRRPGYRDWLFPVDDGVPDRSAPGPEKAAEEAWLRDALVRALQQLPQKQRAVFVLRHFGGCSLREIAQILGCADGTVKAHLSRAVAKLRVLLSDWRISGPERSAHD